MEADSMRWQGVVAKIRADWDWAAAASWALCFGLVVFLGLEGGGYDPLVHDQVGIAAWWGLLLTVAVGALPRRRLGPAALGALGLLTAFALWICLSLIWTESVEKTFIDLARAFSYVAIFALVLISRDSRETQRLIGAVAAAIVVVATVALLSRLHPDWFPTAQQTGRILEAEDRLSFPLNYWNALAALTAIGIPLLLQLASGARWIVTRAAAAAALPAMFLVLYLTLSRGGIAAAAIATLVFLVVATDRLPKLIPLAFAAVAGALLISLAHDREALHEGLANAVAREQGDELLPIVLLICAAVGLLQAGVTAIGRRWRRPAWSRPSKEGATAGFAIGAVALLVVLLAIGAPGRVSDAWAEFKEGGGPGEGSERLSSAAGESRYQFWSSTIDENATAPLIGTGSGTFQFWWAREGDAAETVRDAHSLYMQTLGELGIVGLLLLLGFFAWVFVNGLRVAVLSEGEERSRLAAALAGFLVFLMTAAVDWMWQVPVVPVAALMLACGLLVARGGSDKPRLSVPWRVGLAVISLLAIVAIAIPLSSTSLVRQSQAAVRSNDLTAALEDAKSAQNVEPAAAAPRLQRALVLELLGDFAAAEAAAREAVDRERTNWRLWLVLSRIAAENGRAGASVHAYEEARNLNPLGEIFQR
ncbi:MAG TPA: O-antigen ligase family protein [Solirubrobacterales bacterium]